MRTFRNIEKFLQSKKPMTAIAKEVKETILKKTEKGHDYMGRRFEPYSEAYAKRKKKKTVNLKDSGKMLKAITTKVVTPSHGRVYIKFAGSPNRQIIANIHNTGTGKMPEREFMNLSDSAIKKLAKKHYDDPIMKILGRK